MNRRTRLLALVISQVLLAGLLAAASHAGLHPEDAQPDGDWPFTVSFGGEKTFDGNPLSPGDEIYSLRGSYRYFVGRVGLDALLGYAELEEREADLLVVDLSLTWYVNYDRQIRIFASGSKIKPEVVIFAGPGWAKLENDDPQSSDDETFFTVNGGVAVNLFWFRGPYRTTSHWFVRPELRARWFTGDGGEVDWGGGLAIGYGFGKRQTLRGLDVRVQRCAEGQKGFTELPSAEEHARYLEDLRAQVMECGPERCPGFLETVNGCIAGFDRVLYQLGAAADGRAGAG